MGSQSSHERNSYNQNSQNVTNNRNRNYRVLDLNSEISSRKESEDNSISIAQSTQSEDNTNNNNKGAMNVVNEVENKIPCHFVWKKKGNVVKLVGDFNKWDKDEAQLMKKNPANGFFQATVYLTKMKHQFKFIVDGGWQYSEDYETVKDNNNNINNVIDLTKPTNIHNLKLNISNNTNNTAATTNNVTGNNNVEDQTVKKVNRVPTGRKKSESNPYGCVFPQKNELNIDAPHLPWHYRSKFFLDYQSNQKKIKIKGLPEYLSFNYKQANIFSENNSYKTMLVCPHEKLLHLCTNFYNKEDYNEILCDKSISDINDNIQINENFNINNNNRNSNWKMSVSNRIRHRFLTAVYYIPHK